MGIPPTVNENIMNKSKLAITTTAILAAATLAEGKSIPFERGWCTYQAAVIFNRFAPEPGIDWRGNAVNWYHNAAANGWATTTTPSAIIPGSVIVWSSTIQNAGHVAGVIRTRPGFVTTSEMNFGARDPRSTDPLKTVAFNFVTSRELSIGGTRPTLEGATLRFVGAILPYKTENWHRTQAVRDLGTVVSRNDLGTLATVPTSASTTVRRGWTVRTFVAKKTRFFLRIPIVTETQVQHAVSNTDVNIRETRWKPSGRPWTAWTRAR
jgi:surface antigen